MAAYPPSSDGRKKISPFFAGFSVLKPSRSMEFLRSKLQVFIGDSDDDEDLHNPHHHHTTRLRYFGLKWKDRARKQSLRRF